MKIILSTSSYKDVDSYIMWRFVGRILLKKSLKKYAAAGVILSFTRSGDVWKYFTVWPVKSRQMYIKVDQNWFHKKN